MKLPNAEEQIMKYLWKLEKAFMKDLLNEFSDPKPATTTVATLLRRMIDKGVVGYTQYGKIRQYYPMIKKSDYFASHINGLIKNFFNDSASQFASFFASETNLSEKELEELREIVNHQIENKKN
ncbi:MAG: BlaI/MecI/CopY family transcriptional regulator [Bacteroidales bacterium]|nr:BlaI/MecI/CopY family transcriptional regulator [Bacteroidales bacterium]